MALPKCTPEHDDYDIPHVGKVCMRPLTRPEVDEFAATMDGDTSVEEKEQAVFSILEMSIDEDPKDIHAWLDEMPAYKAEMVIRFILTLSRGGPEVARALGN